MLAPEVTYTMDSAAEVIKCTWEEVACADTYILKIGDKTIRTSETEYSVDYADLNRNIDVYISSYDSNADYLVSEEKEIIKLIDAYVFTGLASATPKLVRYYGNSTNVVLPDNVNGKPYSIADGVFKSRGSIVSVTIGKDVTSISKEAFNGCLRLVEVYNLSSLNITKGANDNGWVGYRALDVYTDKDAPSKLTRENDFVIHTDGNVKTLVGYFGDKTEITIPDNVNGIKNYAFWDCGSLTSIEIPSSVTSIGYGAFHNCSSLTSITIGNSVTSIGNYAFDRCSNLTSVTIPSSVTSIGDFAFRGCSSLTSITIPNSVTSIGDWAFSYCSSLAVIYCEAASKPSGWGGNWDRTGKTSDGIYYNVVWGYTGK